MLTALFLLALGEPAVTPGVEPSSAAASDAPVDLIRKERRERDEARRERRLKRSYEQRTLAGHMFVRPQFVGSALPISFFSLGVGAAGVLVRGQDPATGAARRSAYVAGVGGLYGGARITRWVGISGGVNGLVGVGGSREAVLDAGASAALGWDLDAIVRVLHRRGTALAVGAEFSGAHGRGLVLRPGFEYVLTKVVEYIKEAEDEGEVVVDPRELEEIALRSLRRSASFRGGARVAFAQAITPYFGLQLGLAGGGQRQRLRYYDTAARVAESSGGYLRPGIALSAQTGRVPIAIMVEYNSLMSFGAGATKGQFTAAHDVGLGLFFNGLTQTIGVQSAASFIGDRISAGAMFTLITYI